MSNNSGNPPAYFRRLMSAALDLVVATIPVYANSLINIYPLGNEWSYRFLFGFNFFFVTIILSLISGYGTLGDVLSHLHTVDMNGQVVTKKKLILRNSMYCFYFALGILTCDRVFEYFSFISVTLLFYSTIFSCKNKYNQHLTTLDLVSKTCLAVRFS
jgi:hypothetical protein